ncbi:ATP-binding protein [Kribbella qitaiheensis]|uniref:ATP-binding protein n=1 Tax=Kribbella qitaiheensis TaxID=1544730 RepID=UPI0019D56AC6|nr:tetratricopeptide repeat protein [Kribbella qitaiheensis]
MTQQADSPRTELAGRLQAIQELSGRSLRELQRATGISSSSLSRYFAGRSLPPWSAVVALCKVVQRDPRPLRDLWEQASRLPPPPPPARPTVAGRNDLPLDVADFTGRRAELDAVRESLAAARAVAIDGMAGVGKTCLAVHLAHQLAPEYADGRLYLDLHGFTPGREPLEPASAVRMLLAALEVPVASGLDGSEELAALWRAELAHRRVLVVLDNVASADQARPLLPGAGASAVLITSRNRLVELDQVPPVSLDVLDDADGIELLQQAGGPGDRVANEPDATAEVLRLCGGLPLAIRLSAARLRHRPGWTVGVLADRLRAGSDHVDTALSMSLRQLDHAQRRTFRLLGLLPGATFDDYAVAALTGNTLAATRGSLEDLVDSHLVQQPQAAVYRLHDLVRAYAGRVAAAEESPPEQRQAVVRVLDYYLHSAAAAGKLLRYAYPDEAPLPCPEPAEMPTFADQAAALAWFDHEYPNLVETIAVGSDLHISRLPRLLRPYYFRRAASADENRLLDLALAAASRLGDAGLVAAVQADLGFARYSAGRFPEALQYYESAAATMPDSAALAVRRGYLHQDLGETARAMALFEHAAELFDRDGQPKGVAHATAFQAWAAYQLGQLDEAAALAVKALALQSDAEDWPPPITALVTLGAATGRTDPAAAIEHLTKALRLAREDDHVQNQAWCLNYLAVALRQAGRYDEALADHRTALRLVEDTEPQWAVNFLNSYAETSLAAGQTDEAREIYQQALELAESTGYAHEATVARQGLSRVLTWN